ncbi:MAG: tetratricopeptide repeat protein [Gammaproteobacteria bacterium]|nr:tetratricopeptide repeat protein [Gammaproteobacteria bacterium]
MSVSAVSLVPFNDCELDLASRELRRAGELVAVEPRVFALLAYLIEQRHRAVDKDEIQDVVWKGSIVSETALTRAIMKARRAVGDSAEQQSVIRTVHGHGYQFVAKPSATNLEDSAATDALQSRLTSPRAFAALVVIVLLAFIVFLWPAAAPAEAVRIAIMPVQNDTSDAEFDWTRLGLMGFANDMIARSNVLETLPASDVIRFAEQQDGDDAAADFGKLQGVYNASHMLVSKLEKSASVLRLSYSLYLPDGEVERGTMVGAEPTELMRGMIRTVGAALGDRNRAASEVTVVSDDPFINEAYSRGLSFSLEGRCPEALQLFEVVVASGDTAGRAEYEWANCARIMGRWQEAETAFEDILAKLPAEPASSQRALALNGLGTVYIRTGRGADARATYQLGLSEAQSAGDLLLQGTLLNSLAIDAKNRREFDEARALLARARLAHSEAGTVIVPGQLPAALANIDMAEGKLEQAEAHLEEALEAFRTLGDRRNEAMMLNNFGYLRRLQGRFDDAEPLHLQSLAIRREIGDRVGQGRILGMLSTLYAHNGRLQEARDSATEAYQIASDANDKLFMATGLAQLASVERTAGDVDAARLAYVDAKTIFEEIEDYSRAAQTTLRLAHLEMQAGQLSSAEVTAEEVRKLSLREALQEPAIEAMELLGDIARERGDSEKAVSAYRDALEHIEETGFVSREGRLVRKLAHVFLDERNLAEAEPLIGYMIEQGDTAESLKLRARYAFVKDDAGRSIELQEAARDAAPDDWSEHDAETLTRYYDAATE